MVDELHRSAEESTLPRSPMLGVPAVHSGHRYSPCAHTLIWPTCQTLLDMRQCDDGMQQKDGALHGTHISDGTKIRTKHASGY